MTARTASRPHGRRRGASSTSTPRPPRCARTSSGPSGGVLGVRRQASTGPRSPPRPGTYRAELSWAGEPGSAAAIASALRGWNHLRFEVTEEPTAVAEGARYSYTPDLGVFHAVTGLHGDIMIPEDRLKAAVVKAALGDTTLLTRDRQAARQAVGRRARDLPARRRRRPGALAAPGRLTRGPVALSGSAGSAPAGTIGGGRRAGPSAAGRGWFQLNLALMV